MTNRKFHTHLEQHQCVACSATFDSGSIFMQKRATVEPIVPAGAVTGNGVCPKCEERIARGHTLLVAVDPAASSAVMGDVVTDPSSVQRTGHIAEIGNDLYERAFQSEPPKNGIVFVEEEILWKLNEAVNKMKNVTDNPEVEGKSIH